MGELHFAPPFPNTQLYDRVSENEFLSSKCTTVVRKYLRSEDRNRRKNRMIVTNYMDVRNAHVRVYLYSVLILVPNILSCHYEHLFLLVPISWTCPIPNTMYFFDSSLRTPFPNILSFFLCPGTVTDFNHGCSE